MLEALGGQITWGKCSLVRGCLLFLTAICQVMLQDAIYFATFEGKVALQDPVVQHLSPNIPQCPTTICKPGGSSDSGRSNSASPGGIARAAPSLQHVGNTAAPGPDIHYLATCQASSMTDPQLREEAIKTSNEFQVFYKAWKVNHAD